MIVVDWRTGTAADVAVCYERARAEWSARYLWDTTDNWHEVEAGRASGRLPGYLAWDNGPAPAGWCFYLRHRSSVQIGGLVGESPAVVEGLLDRMLTSPEAVGEGQAMAFVPDGPTFLSDVFTARGFVVRTFQYLICTLDGAEVSEASGCRSYHPGRLAAVAHLLARAYPGADPARPFSPGGSPNEWLEYSAQLATTTGCGSLLPWASVVAEGSDSTQRLVGAVLTTAIGPGIGHMAQVAVDSATQGQGIGGRLLRTALARLRARGFTHATLLVADDNHRARDWYVRLGFEARGAFVSATAPWPAAHEPATRSSLRRSMPRQRVRSVRLSP